MDIKERTLQTGFHRVKITPPLGLHIPGYGSRERNADGIVSDIYLYTTVFSDGENIAALFSVDALAVTFDAYKDIKKILFEEFNINEDNVYIAATHSHTAISVLSPTELVTKDSVQHTYQKWLQLAFRDSVRFALNDMKPTIIRVASGEAKNTAFIRRYRFKDGSIVGYTNVGNENLVGSIGMHDNSVQLVRLVREGGKEILLVNFGTHPDHIGGTKYSADFPGYLVDYLTGAFDGNVHVMFLNGAQGDSNGVNRLWNESWYKNKAKDWPWTSRRIARSIAGEVLKIYDWADEIPSAKVEGYNVTIQIGNTFTEEELELAKIVYSIYREKGNLAEELKQYSEKMDWSFSSRIMNSLNTPEFISQQVSGLRIGNLLFIGIPGEPFSEIGMRIKAKSKFDMTFVTCCTNHRAGYFPSEAAYAVDKGFEKESSPFASNCAQCLVDGAIQIMEHFDLIED